MSETKRPEWVHCIEHTHTQKRGTTWCGRSPLISDFLFQGIDHAAYSTLSESRLVTCPECVEAIASLLRMDVPF